MDQPLTEALAADLDGAFEELVRAQQDRLYSLALRYSGNAADAEELAQDAFVRAYRAHGAVRPGADPRPRPPRMAHHDPPEPLP